MKINIRLSLIIGLLLSIVSYSDLTIQKHNNFIGHSNFLAIGNNNALNISKTDWGTIISGEGFTGFENNIISDLAENGIVAIEDPLFYPSPFSLDNKDVILGFSLNLTAEIELRLYDMRGNEVLKHDYGTQSPPYVKVAFDDSVYGNKEFPAGVYYYIILSDGEILGNGKFALLP
jgi:hypothetical protein